MSNAQQTLNNDNKVMQL